jgi:tungstate transport system permease protein
MDTLSQATSAAARLIGSGNADLVSAVKTSLSVSLTATAIACLVGAPLGAFMAIRPFPGRPAALIVVNALLGMPPVVVGLIVYLLLSRPGPLGGLGLLFTTKAMIMAQVALTLPIVVALTHRATNTFWKDFGDALLIDGARTWRCVLVLLAMARSALVTVGLAAFGRAIAEVGAIMIVGGNIRGHTRTMTTAIALETSKGDLALAVALGMILVALTVLVSGAAFVLGRAADRD